MMPRSVMRHSLTVTASGAPVLPGSLRLLRRVTERGYPQIPHARRGRSDADPTLTLTLISTLSLTLTLTITLNLNPNPVHAGWSRLAVLPRGALAAGAGRGAVHVHAAAVRHHPDGCAMAAVIHRSNFRTWSMTPLRGGQAASMFSNPVPSLARSSPRLIMAHQMVQCY